jgi:hypothetical protein
MNPLVVQGAAQLLLGKYKSEKGLFMKNILSMAATGLVIFAGLGWYLDWYKVARTTTPDGKQQITFDINTKRIESDFEKGRNQVSGYLQNTSGTSFPSPTPPTPFPNQQNQQPFPNQGFQPQQPALPPQGFQQQPQNGWIPAAPVNRPSNNGFVFPGQQGSVPPPPSIPGRPF